MLIKINKLMTTLTGTGVIDQPNGEFSRNPFSPRVVRMCNLLQQGVAVGKSMDTFKGGEAG